MTGAASGIACDATVAFVLGLLVAPATGAAGTHSVATIASAVGTTSRRTLRNRSTFISGFPREPPHRGSVSREIGRIPGSVEEFGRNAPRPGRSGEGGG